MSKLKRTDTASYSRASKQETLEHADPITAARARGLRVEHAPPEVLRGIERFTGLRVLEVVVDAPLDLAPLGGGRLPELFAVELELDAAVSGEEGLAALPAFRDFTLTGDAEWLPVVVAGLAWGRIGSPRYVDLVARGGAFVVDVTPLGALPSLEALVGDRVVLGPRDVAGEVFAALLPPRLHSLHSAYVDEHDKKRLTDAEAARPPAPRDTPGEPGFSYDRVRLETPAVGDEPGVWSPDSEDSSWMLELDVVPIVGGDPDDGEVNYRAQELVDDRLRREHPALAGRVEYDTTGEALLVIVSDSDAEDREHIDQAVRAAISALGQAD